MRSRLILFHEMLLTHMKNTFSSSKEGIHDYLEQHTKVITRCATSFVGGFDFAYIEVVNDCIYSAFVMVWIVCVRISGCAAEVQEGNIRKTMAARGLVNGRSRAISESSGGCSLLLPPSKKQRLTQKVSLSLFYFRQK